jgi:hypothetical protein
MAACQKKEAIFVHKKESKRNFPSILLKFENLKGLNFIFFLNQLYPP